MPDGVFYVVMGIAFLANMYMVYNGARGLSPVVLGINIAYVVICIIYTFARIRCGKVHVDKTLGLEEAR